MSAVPPSPRAAAARPRWMSALRIGLAGSIVGAAAWLVRDLGASRMGALLAHAAWPIVALAAALNLTLNTVARTLRWRALLPRGRAGDGGGPSAAPRFPFWPLARLFLASQATNTVLPFRAGEAMRVLGVHQRSGQPVRVAVAAQGVEKLVEIASLGAWSIPVLLAPERSGPLLARAGLALMTLVALLVLAGLAVRIVLATRSRLIAPARRLVLSARESVRVLGGPRAWACSFGWAAASDAIDVASIALCAAALGLHVGLTTWCAVLLGVNLAIALPSTPAQLGVHEAGAIIVLAGLGVAHEKALAFALVYHAVHVVPTTIAGGVALAFPARPVPREAVPREAGAREVRLSHDRGR